jgi:predicted alpha/beta-fold hydrolase
MGGTIDSSYVRAMAVGLLRGGYPVARVDLRGTGDSREHSRNLYHGGRTDDLRDVLGELARRDGFDGLAQVGWSLGGNLTLKLLGEPLEDLPVRAAASVCAPLDLLNDTEHISRRMGGLYQRALVRGIRADTLNSKLDLTETEREQVRRVRTIVEFDSLITARRNGWRDAAEYYVVNSSAQFLPHITVPTLVVHAIDDPMIPDTAYRAVDWDLLARTTAVRRAITPHGGHCGFHEQGADLPWFVGRIRRFLDETCPDPTT